MIGLSNRLNFEIKDDTYDEKSGIHWMFRFAEFSINVKPTSKITSKIL